MGPFVCSEILIILFLSSQLQIKLSDASHQDCNVLVSLAHFGLVLGVLGFVVVNLPTRLDLHSVNALLKLSAPLNQFSTFDPCLL